MNCILDALDRLCPWEEMLDANYSIAGVPEQSSPFLFQYLATRFQRPVLAVYQTDAAAKRAFEEQVFREKLYLPSPDTELRMMDAKGRDVTQERAYALGNMRGNVVVFLSIDALLYKSRPKKQFFDAFLRLSAGQIIPPKELAARLAQAGYERSELTEAPGQFSGRGDILDVFPPGMDDPFRISFFDDEIESIRAFDADSQRSIGAPLEQVSIGPADDMLLTPEDRAVLAQYLRAHGQGGERYADEVEETGTFPNISAFAGVFDQYATAADYAEHPIIVFQDKRAIQRDHERMEKERQAFLADVMENEGAFGCECLCREELSAFLARHSIWEIPLLDPVFSNKADLGLRTAAGFSGDMELLCSSLKLRIQAGWRVYLFVGSKARHLSSALLEQGLEAPVTQGAPLSGPGAASVNARISLGFEDGAGKNLFLSEGDVFGVARRRKAPRKKPRKKDEEFLADLKVGDIVVHEVHGKGRFLGLQTREILGVSQDYLELEYRNGDKLFVPTAQIDRIDKYIGPSDGEVRLSKMGGREWENAKAKASASVKKLAEDLVSIYAERENSQGYQFSPDTVWQAQFEDNFDYEETEGQLRSIDEIKRDMQSARIMDRLLLGDVGYGKTEVAMRACFKAVMDSKQVAVLVPTTLLARQHYETFKERFTGFPVNIGLLSRFSKNPKKVMQAARDGSLDILIGTHKLLSKELAFKDLGLLVIDEEQRFGVSHKERIKDMKRTVDVLTLTATPIPRTLEMAMTGIRNMSTIDTPPPDRKEVQAYVAEFSWGLVRDAITKELKRGGQAYFVCRRIGEMDELLRRLQHELPEARIAVAHGQMNEADFDDIITAFYEKQYDVLLCTTIIESGIDIPSVNTVIVYEADQFGLSQLYQLKGRVGRSAARAYAYFTYLGDNLSEIAAKRLAAIKEFTRFGSGMKIAMRDLEIRGAGNILGPEQSGHMAQIGYGLYCKLVREHVSSAMGAPVRSKIDSSIELGISAFIPGSYIPDEALKIDMYRRISGIQNSREAKDVLGELTDRFGKPPKEVENLLSIAVIRAAAERARIASVIKKPMFVELKFHPGATMDPARLAKILKAYKDVATLRPSEPPAIVVKPVRGRFYQDLLSLMDRISHIVEV